MIVSVLSARGRAAVSDGIQGQLQATLTRLVDAGTLDAASVRAAVEAISGRPPVFVDVAGLDGNVGVVVGLPDQAECVAGPIIDQSTVEAWTVPRVLAQPGGRGCGTGAAASGSNQRPPH